MSATVLVAGTFGATGQSSSFRPIGKFNDTGTGAGSWKVA